MQGERTDEGLLSGREARRRSRHWFSVSVMTHDEEAERQRCRRLLGGAPIGFLLCGAGWVLVSAAADRNFSSFMFVLLIFSGYMGFVGGSLYYGWRTLWYGIPLVVLSVPSTWRNVVQGAVLLLLWLGPLFYFIPASSGLMSIVERTSGWIVFGAALIGLLGYGLGVVVSEAIFRLPVRPLLVAVVVVFVLCFMTKNEITLELSDSELLTTSEETTSEERAYLHYLLYSAVAVGGVLLGRRALLHEAQLRGRDARLRR